MAFLSEQQMEEELPDQSTNIIMMNNRHSKCLEEQIPSTTWEIIAPENYSPSFPLPSDK